MIASNPLPIPTLKIEIPVPREDQISVGIVNRIDKSLASYAIEHC